MRETKMNLLKIGIVGSIVAAICCFTPILVILFTAIGIASMVAYLDYVLLPILTLFIVIAIYGILNRRTA
jgi:mercuric ion transport protein